MKTQIKTHTAIQFTALVVCLLCAGLRTARAASQTWSNAPANALFNNANNWVGTNVPGALNQTGNSVNNDVVTINSPLAGGIGGASNPILTDDGTINGDRARTVGSILFDTANCGAYVISNASPAVLATTGSPETGILNVSHNGSIQITGTVTNSQVFMVPVFIRLPSSTAGVFTFLNNATNPSTTLTITCATNDSATTRGTVFTLDGTNTGPNTIGALAAGTTTTGANGLTKNGTGTWILAGANDFRAQTAVNVNNGLLIVKDPNAFSIATSATVAGGTLQIDGVTLFQNALTLRGGGTIRMDGTASINGVTVGNATGTTGTLSTTSASDVFTVGTGAVAASVVGGGASDSVLFTAGPGTLVFGQANTYVGKWQFNAKTNQINNASALGTGSTANIGAGAVLDLTPLGPTFFTPTTAGLGGSGAGTTVGSTAATVLADPGATLTMTANKALNLTYTPTSASGDLTHPALYIAQGTLSIGGNTFFLNNASGTPLGVGTYRLIQQASGSVTDGGGYAVIVSGSGLAGGTVANVVVSGGNIDLSVSLYVPKNLIWTGGNPDNTWNTAGAANFLNGAVHSVFTASDNVLFNSVGTSNSTVALSGTISPGSVVVDTSGGDYTFSGSGQIAGTTSLLKNSPGNLLVQTVNSYGGGTVVSNGTLRLGVANALSSSGTGDVSVYGTGTLDMNTFDNMINGLIGSGTVDNQGGSISTLTVGNNDRSGTFGGVLKNTSGSLALTKVGLGTEILTSSNSYAGATTVNLGVLAAVNDHALGSNDVVINGGTLDVRSPRLFVNSLAGSGGAVENDTTTGTNDLIIQGSSATTFSGAVNNGSGGGGMALTVLGGTLTMAGNNTYTGGTYVGTGASFAIPNSPAVVTGPLTASNNATLSLSGGSGTPGTPNQVTTVDGATVVFTAGAEGKIWQAQFVGNPGTTNRITTVMSFGQTNSFQNFLGLVRLEANGNVRFFNGGSTSGGDNTTFEFSPTNTTLVHTRDAQTVNLGQIRGGNFGAGIDGGTAAGVIDTYVIGAKGQDCIFEGYFRGSNNLVKVGAGRLQFDGYDVTTNTDNTTYTNYLFSDSIVTHFGTTTISNGLLTLVAPNTLTNSPSITLAAATAVLDGTQMGYVSNNVDITQTPTNSFLVTNGLFELITGQTLGGVGKVAATTVNADAGSTVAPGLDSNIYGNLTIFGVFDSEGAVNLKVGHVGSAVSDKLTSTNMTLNGTITVTQADTNDLLSGDVFTLFSGPVKGFATNAVTLPLTNSTGSITYVWTNRLAIDGTIKLLVGGTPLVNTNPTNITFSASGGNLTLSWPADHIGWRLQNQTNALNAGLKNSSWVDVAGSTATNQVILSISATNPAVFFRLTYP
jgi:autotransporter-associated beta strand protein